MNTNIITGITKDLITLILTNIEIPMSIDTTVGTTIEANTIKTGDITGDPMVTIDTRNITDIVITKRGTITVINVF